MMALRSDSYSSTGEVVAFTRHLLDGQSTFNSTTLPTVTEVEKFIDRASGLLNLALAQKGFSTPITNTTAKLTCDDWVTGRAVEYVELTQRGTGFGETENSRSFFAALYEDAGSFASDFNLGLKRMGVTVSDPSRQGLTFTALDVHSERSDPDDSTLRQPFFRRGQFDVEVEADNT